MKNISIIIPCHNEEQNIEIFYNTAKKLFSTTKYQFELIFIDDGSTDHTYLEITKLLKKTDCVIKAIKFSRNFGKESAIYAGLEHSEGDYAVLIDADMQQDPLLIKDMLKILEDDHTYDSVCCYQEKRKEGKILGFFKNQFYKIMNKFCDIEFVQGASDFRLLNRDMIDAILKMPEKNRFSKGIFSWVGFKTYYMPYTVNDRMNGKTNWSFRKLFRYAITGIEAFSSLPLKIISCLGFLLFIPSFLYLIALIVMTILGNHSLAINYLFDVIILMSGLNLIALGVIGEYISRIYDEAKNRPIYLSNSVKSNKKQE